MGGGKLPREHVAVRRLEAEPLPEGTGSATEQPRALAALLRGLHEREPAES